MKRIVLYLAAAVLMLLSFSFLTFTQPLLKKTKTENIFEADSLILKKHVRFLSEIQPARNYLHSASLNSCAQYILNIFKENADTAYYQKYFFGGVEYKNVIAVFGDQHSKKFVVGAHYDVCEELPGADDNASGVACLLELARLLKGKELNHKIELIAYTLEEPPFFRTENMGSAVHAKSLLNDKENVLGMLSLEMIGYFSDVEGSQTYPVSALGLLYPNTGNFIAVTGKIGQGKFTRKIKSGMKKGSKKEVVSINAPAALPGIDFSDHLNYWKYDFNAVMITNTGFYRNKNYHTALDTYEKLNYSKMKQVVESVAYVVCGYQ